MDNAQSQFVQERMIWSGSPSQWLNFRSFLISGILIILLIAGLAWLGGAGAGTFGTGQMPAMGALAIFLLAVLFYLLKRYLDIKCQHYDISDQRVRATRGILSKRTDGLELYRVDDTLLFEPLLLRLVGRGNVRLVTSDRTNPDMQIHAVPNAKWLWDEIRKAVEACRDRKRTRVVDFESHP